MTEILRVRDAAVSFGGVRAVAGMSLRVERGTIVGLIGPNGAGKTTLFNTISGLQRLDSGQVFFNGRDVTALEAHQRAALGIGRSFQNLGLMTEESVDTNVVAAQHVRSPYTGRDLVTRPVRWWRGERAMAAQARTALAAFGLDADRARRVGDLSFAKARFVELAAVLAAAPELMLLDEPTTGLDVAEVATLLATLRQVRESGTSILVIAHDVAFVLELCDYVYALAQGQLLAEGLPEAVRNDPAVVDAYVGVGA